MKKIIRSENAFYSISWSPFEKYDRHILTRIMPELPGITGLFYQEKGKYVPVLFLECWRDGIRGGIKNFMDPVFQKFRGLRESVDIEKVWISFTVITSSASDLADILYCLINTYRPELNSLLFTHSGRYKNVYLSEDQKEYTVR